MVRGLMTWNARLPLFLFMANRSRAGKDFLNGVAQTLYYGNAFEDPAIASQSSEETRKQITSALIAGRRSMHFANQQDFLNDAAFIQAITNPVHNDRRLGSNTYLSFPNELEFTMSGNVGLQWREDITPRIRIISLAYFEQDPNKRTFSIPDLHRYVRENRELILSAIYTLILNWKRQGCPLGNTFSSFQRWGEVVGGILLANGLGDPTELHKDTPALDIGGDPREEAMKELFVAANNKHGDAWIKAIDFRSLSR